MRKKSKLSVPDRNVEPAVASIGVVPDVSIRHELELKVHLALQEKGIKITDYNEDIPRPKPKKKKS